MAFLENLQESISNSVNISNSICNTLLISLLFLITLFLIISVIQSVKNRKHISSWVTLNKNLEFWKFEIKDELVRDEFTSYCIRKIFTLKSDTIEDILKININKIEKDIADKYSDHIPSVKSEIRDRRLNQILK